MGEKEMAAVAFSGRAHCSYGDDGVALQTGALEVSKTWLNRFEAKVPLRDGVDPLEVRVGFPKDGRLLVEIAEPEPWFERSALFLTLAPGPSGWSPESVAAFMFIDVPAVGGWAQELRGFVTVQSGDTARRAPLEAIFEIEGKTGAGTDIRLVGAFHIVPDAAPGLTRPLRYGFPFPQPATNR